MHLRFHLVLLVLQLKSQRKNVFLACAITLFAINILYTKVGCILFLCLRLASQDYFMDVFLIQETSISINCLHWRRVAIEKIRIFKNWDQKYDREQHICSYLITHLPGRTNNYPSPFISNLTIVFTTLLLTSLCMDKAIDAHQRKTI